MWKSLPGRITLSLLAFLVIVSGFVVALSPSATQAKQVAGNSGDYPHYREKHVIINLSSNVVSLHDVDGTIMELPILTQGKPGSYYETIGGYYKNDYKEPLHFSSFGHVYMPWSIHIFGNYFIHGIPYYPDGTKVSSSYSGGCVRLEDSNAKIIYDFITPGTPITIIRKDEEEFSPSEADVRKIRSAEMVRLMAAIVSLETVNQGDLLFVSGTGTIPILSSLPELLARNDTSIASIYGNHVGKEEFLRRMNSKARSIGLSSTVFTTLEDSVTTTESDYTRLQNYIHTYKSYLIQINQEEVKN